MKNIKSIDKYFKFDERKGQVIFDSKTLKCYILQRYSNKGLLSVGNTIKTIGTMIIEIDEQYQCYWNLLTSIEMEYTEVKQNVNRDGNIYTVATLKKGDKFLISNKYFQQPDIPYHVYVESVTMGNLPTDVIGYEDGLPYLFDQANEVCGTNLKVYHPLIEMILAHITRDKNDQSVPVRYSKPKNGNVGNNYDIKSLASISTSALDNPSRLIGSYFTEGLIAAINDTNNTNESTPDNIARGIYRPVSLD